MEIANKRNIQRAWTFYDWANSVYNLVITATIFPIYYKIVTEVRNSTGETIKNTVNFLGFELKNTTLYDWAIAFSYLVISILIPILSGIADSSNSKKRFMKFFCYLGALSCAGMYFFTADNLGYGITCACLACMGWAGSLVFYNAFIPEIAEKSEQDGLSARGFSMGYWGSAILLILALSLIMTRETGEEKLLMMRYSFLGVGIWWIGFAQIPFYFLPNGKIFDAESVENKFTKGFLELKKVWIELKKNPVIAKFLLAFFIYSMGVQTVMLIANHFGSEEIKMEADQLIITILIIQFVAIAGAHLFSFLSSKKGNVFTLQIATFIWSLICIGTFLFVQTPQDFYIVAGVVGLVMGGIQALSRSTFSKLVPQTEDNASYFSYYDVTEKLSIVCGMALFGFFNQIGSSMRSPILLLIVFFVTGFILLFRVKIIKH